MNYFTEYNQSAPTIYGRSALKFATSLEEVEDSWNTLYIHIKNTYNKAGEVNEKHNRLKVTFEQITETEEQAATND